MGTLYKGHFRTRTFADIFEDFTDFKSWYGSCGVEKTINDGTDATKPNYLQNLYFVLLSNFANSHIASSDENRFKFKVMTTIWQYGPAWAKRLEMQKTLRETDLDDLRASLSVFNRADAPEDAPGTMDIDGLDYISAQNVGHQLRNKLDAYTQLMALVEDDVTEQFVSKFRPLFIAFPPEQPILFESEEDEDDGYY